MIDGSAFKNELQKLGRELYDNASHAMQYCVAEAELAAKTTSLFKDQSGTLRSKIAGSTSSTSLNIWGKLIANTPYATYVENGQPAHDIPKTLGGKTLRFVSNGQVYFRKQVFHKGTIPRPFMAVAAKHGEKVLESSLEAYTHISISHFNN